MNKKFNVIKINGLKGLFIAAFIIGCLIAGFLIFPGWLCMHVWNFVAGFFTDMPTMNMLHGAILWCIVALSLYAINKGNLSISFGHSAPVVAANEERIKEILRQINEKNTQIIASEKQIDDNHSENSQNDNNDDKIVK